MRDKVVAAKFCARTERTRGLVESVSEFLQMGGYGAYVWSAFGFAALVLIGLLVQSVLQARRREREFVRLREIARPAAGRPAPKPRTAVRARPVIAAGEAGER